MTSSELRHRPILRLGTRGSPLALAQAHAVQVALAAASGEMPERFEIVPIRTTGDAIQDRALSEAGGKGLFTIELDRALIAGGIDLAVHSAKDLPTFLPHEIAIAGYLEREDPRDVFVSRRAARFDQLPPNAVLGSASLRRGALARRLRPDLRVELLRGTVETRLRRIEEGRYDATLLALAGLKRLGLAAHATAVLDETRFVPAVGQGAIAITARTGDARVADALRPILHADTGLALGCERAFLAVLDGSCRTPIAGYARRLGDDLEFRGLLLAPDGSEAVETVVRAPANEATVLGEAAGRDLLTRASASLLAGIGLAPRP